MPSPTNNGARIVDDDWVWNVTQLSNRDIYAMMCHQTFDDGDLFSPTTLLQADYGTRYIYF